MLLAVKRPLLSVNSFRSLNSSCSPACRVYVRTCFRKMGFARVNTSCYLGCFTAHTCVALKYTHRPGHAPSYTYRPEVGHFSPSFPRFDVCLQVSIETRIGGTLRRGDCDACEQDFVGIYLIELLRLPCAHLPPQINQCEPLVANPVLNCLRIYIVYAFTFSQNLLQ